MTPFSIAVLVACLSPFILATATSWRQPRALLLGAGFVVFGLGAGVGLILASDALDASPAFFVVAGAVVAWEAYRYARRRRLKA